MDRRTLSACIHDQISFRPRVISSHDQKLRREKSFLALNRLKTCTPLPKKVSKARQFYRMQELFAFQQLLGWGKPEISLVIADNADDICKAVRR